MIYSGDETCDVGCDTGTPVSEDYTSDASPLHWHRATGSNSTSATTATTTSSPQKSSCASPPPSNDTLW